MKPGYWILLASLLALAAGSSPAKDVLIAQFEGVIGPASARYMVQAVDLAEKRGAECVVFEMDTPGGLDESMRVIIKRILASKVPVVVYVAPSGARAASAGAFITLSAHVAAMAPGTTIGAAHPVSMGGVGQMDTNMAAKVANDAAAYIRAIAEKRGRNAVWAESAVRESVALSETEALENNVVDLVVASMDDLLAALDGRSVGMGAHTIVLATKGAGTERIEMTWRDRFLATIANPNLAYILFVLGLLGLYFELSTPGAVLPGVAGAICLILALFAFQTLSVNYAGVLLIVFSVILFIVDAKAATHGVLTTGGLIAMFIGSVMLFDMPEQSVRLSLHVIVPVVLATGLFFAIGVWLSARALRRRPTTGDAGLAGQQGDARTDVNRDGGTVFLAGAHWNAVAKSDIPSGRPVRVLGMKGMTVEVEEVGGQG